MARTRSKRPLLFVFLGAAVAIAVGVWLSWNKPHQKAEDVTGLRTDAAALYAAFSDKAAGAYDGKVLEVSGIVSETSVNQDGKAVVLLGTADPMGVVQCTFREGSAPAAGAKVTIKGFCNGYTDMEGMGGTVVLNDCIQIR